MATLQCHEIVKTFNLLIFYAFKQKKVRRIQFTDLPLNRQRTQTREIGTTNQLYMYVCMEEGEE